MRISDWSSDVCSSDLGRLRGHQHVRDLVDAGELVHRAHEEALRALLQAAAGNVDVLLLQPLDHGLDRQVQLGQLLLVDIDLDIVLEATADLDRGEALDRSDEQTSELHSLMRTSYAVLCLK